MERREEDNYFLICSVSSTAFYKTFFFISGLRIQLSAGLVQMSGFRMNYTLNNLDILKKKITNSAVFGISYILPKLSLFPVT